MIQPGENSTKAVRAVFFIDPDNIRSFQKKKYKINQVSNRYS